MGEAGAEASVRRTHSVLADLCATNTLRWPWPSAAVPCRPRHLSLPPCLDYRHSAGGTHPSSADARQVWEGVELLSGEANELSN